MQTSRPHAPVSNERNLNLGSSPDDAVLVFQHHRPASWLDDAFHFHTSIEINFLRDCDMTYSFSGEEVTIHAGQFCVFWAAYPHRAIDVSADGTITNAYVALSEFLQWPLPVEFVNTLMSGAVLTTGRELDGDDALVRRWETELNFTGPSWQRLHALEIQARLARMAVEGWTCCFVPRPIRHHS